MKKKSYFLLGVVGLILLSALILRLTSSEDDWVCKNGQWQKHGNPSALMPTSVCPSAQEQMNKENNTQVNPNETATGSEATFSQEALVLRPKTNELITSPLQVQGSVVGSWFFEGVLPVKLVDKNNNVIASGQATAEGDWMTTKPVRYSATLEFSLASTTATSGYLVLSKDNPSDLQQNAASITVPVRFK